MLEPKVVCLGFQKTGTSSLGLALEKLGYHPASYTQFRDLIELDTQDIEKSIKERARSLLDKYDAFKDTPWPILYREMDEWLPGSKFILITRDEDRWINSVVHDFGSFENPIHQYIYGAGAPVGNEEIYRERYRKHNAEVREYFKDRPSDFIHLHLDRGEVNWENVCKFLDHPVPQTSWPHANTVKQKRRLMFRLKLADKLKQVFKVKK